MSLPQGFLDELRGRLSLAQVVGRKLAWDPRKTNAARGDYWAPCPFHQEKTASFHVDDAKGYYYCFGCHAKGDAISFLRETENMAFIEAVEALARDAGMEMPERIGAPREVEDRRARLASAMEAAVGFFRLQLNAARGAEARAYLDRRGLLPATRERFEIGFAPEGWTALSEHLAGKGFTPDELAEAGLVQARDDGRRPYDRFRNRVIFPIRDTRGRAIAFGGRALDAAERAKYYNSPETPLFDKGRTLFNHGPARTAARGGPLLVVEGYMDVVSLVQAGFEATVAPMGTAITEDQLEALWRIHPEPVVALDGDRAGLEAAQKLIDLALPRLVAGRSLRFLPLPEGQDPDDVVRAGGRAAFEALLGGSLPIVELLWRRETEGQPLDSPERRAALDARLKAHLARIRDDSLRAHTSAALRERRAALFAPPRGAPAPRTGRRGPPAARGFAKAVGSMGRSGFDALPTAAAKASFLGRAAEGLAPEARIRESAILLGLINHPEIVPQFEERLERMGFLCPDLGAVRDALISCLASGEPASLAERLSARLGRDLRHQLGALGLERANPHLAPDADPGSAARAIEAGMMRHAAWLDVASEVRDAEQALAGEADEGVTWRLRQATDAHHQEGAAALEEEVGPAEGDGESLASRLLAAVAYKKTRGR